MREYTYPFGVVPSDVKTRSGGNGPTQYSREVLQLEDGRWVIRWETDFDKDEEEMGR